MSCKLTDEQKAERKATRERNKLEAIKRFDDLPDSAGVCVHTVAAVTGYSVPSVWRLSREGRLPKPRRISSNTTRWIVGEVRATRNRPEFDGESSIQRAHNALAAQRTSAA
jgi:predicted DNA-binding transcriptional regulator AlpA